MGPERKVRPAAIQDVPPKAARLARVDRIGLGDALTFWTVPHPAWAPNPEWPEDVGFVTWKSTDTYVFIDPLVRDDLDPRA